MARRKKIIGIDINEVVRAHFMMFALKYEQEFGPGGMKEPFDTYEYLNHFEFKDQAVEMRLLKQDTPYELKLLPDSHNYILNEDQPETAITKAEELLTEVEVEQVDKELALQKFMWEDYVYELYGACPSINKEAPLNVEMFFKKFKKQFEIRIVMQENVLTRPSTYFFLSKTRNRIGTVNLVDTEEEVWSNVDYYITTNPKFLNNKPSNKKTIKILRPFNVDCEADFTAGQILELLDSTEFDDFVGLLKKYRYKK